MHEKTIRNLKITRLLLSGALVGIAMGNILGLDASVLLDLVGDQSKELVNAVAGASVTAIVLKAVHMV